MYIWIRSSYYSLLEHYIHKINFQHFQCFLEVEICIFPGPPWGSKCPSDVQLIDRPTENNLLFATLYIYIYIYIYPSTFSDLFFMKAITQQVSACLPLQLGVHMGCCKPPCGVSGQCSWRLWLFYQSQVFKQPFHVSFGDLIFCFFRSLFASVRLA